jgi:hypothetical protein
MSNLLERRQLLIAPVLSALVNQAEASAVDPRETFVVQPKEIQFKPWQGLPPASGEMAALYGLRLERVDRYRRSPNSGAQNSGRWTSSMAALACCVVRLLNLELAKVRPHRQLADKKIREILSAEQKEKLD